MKKFLLSLAAVCCACLAMANVTLPRIFGNNMVLQRNQPIPVWGWAEPGEKITIQFNKQSKTIAAGTDGNWKTELGAETAGGPYTFTVKGNNTVNFDNVLVGEVWVCSGQSNMSMNVRNSKDAEKEIATSDFPQIRQIQAPNVVAGEPAKDIPRGNWVIAGPATTGNFTAVGYFFARKLFNELHIPIGIINTSWGGTMVETWISREAFLQTEEFKNLFDSVSFADLPVATDKPNSYPTLLFNAMINPLIPYGIKGALWYQGESNASRAYEYRKTFPLMIKDWRSRWQQGNFPFYFVQLASFNAAGGNSSKGSSWAELREAQTKTLSVPNTGMAVTLDIGETHDIHPKNKQDVGARLAAIALNDLYGKKMEWSGPVYKSMQAKGGKLLLSFTHAAKGFTVKGDSGSIGGFEIAGEDKLFYQAKAVIEKDKVLVSSDSVAKPVAVRYGWADDMPQANLYNKEGFPASPFRTDTWKGITETAKYRVSK